MDERNDTVTLDSAPSEWNVKTLLENWHQHLRSIIDDKKTDLPFERLCFQAQADTAYADIIAKWSTMTGKERTAGWNTLLEAAKKGVEEMLPICVRCGNCCTAGSPTLVKEDLELLGEDGIRWSHLVTLRRGEPAHSRIIDQPFFLTEEKIKIAEKPGTKVCVLYDEETKSCGIHPNKPAQCRAQACWDPTLTTQQAEMPALSRSDIFGDMEMLMELIDKHEERCDFERFRTSFETLRDTRGENIDELLQMLGFDEHVREFAMEKLGIPEDGLALVFGRPLVARLALFGFEVVDGEDGSRMLMPLSKGE